MTATVSAGSVNRVLVALDGSRQSQAALKTAVRLAEWHQAELCGIYVEDIDLIRLATLPVAREIGPTSISPDPLTPERLGRRLTLGADESRRRLAESADQRRVRWTFRVERGDVTSVILAAAGDVDVVALGRAGTGTSGPGRLGSTARALATRPSVSVIVVQAPLTPGHVVATIFDGSEACARAVDTAARWCEQLEARLVVLVPESTDTAATAARLAQAADLVRGANVRTSVRPVRLAEDDLARAVRAERPALCVMACQTPAGAELVRQLTDRLQLSVYLVKSP